MKISVLLVFVSLFFFSCSKEKFETKIWVIASQKTTCGLLFGGTTPCLQVKQSANEPFRGFNENIEGFVYVDGFEYIIEVKVYKVENPPADGSSLRYVLSRIISKK